MMSLVRCSAFLCFDTDGFVSRTAVAQWNSHARTVLDYVKITTRSVSQTDPELDPPCGTRNVSSESRVGLRCGRLVRT